MIKPEDFDAIILKEMREPINDLLQKYCFNMTLEAIATMRLLPYYALDILIHTGVANGLQNETTVKKIIEKIRLLNGSEKFINESIGLAIAIYEKIRSNHPDLLERYKLN